ncbi:MAG: hypothetical protein K5739_12525 [Lachnospiraceae bacterium]|nr:hypothetical protein [Lachnospiraceae bacterium]
MKRTIGIIAIMILSLLMLTACTYDPEKIEEKHRKHLMEQEEECKKVTDEMERRLSEKYAGILGNDPDEIVFHVYDLSSGGHQAMFMGGFYPAKAVYENNEEEFTVQMEVPPNVKDFGEMEDSFYGILNGEDVKAELYNLVESYGVEKLNIYYEPCKDILSDEKDLREHLTVFGHLTMNSYDELDTICELAEKVNAYGCNNRISVDAYDLCKKSSGIGNMSTDEIREFFKK